MGTQLIEFTMTLVGLWLLMRQRLTLAGRTISGWQARAVGLSLFLPLPLTLLLGLVLSVLLVQGVIEPALVLAFNTAELGLVLGGLAAAVVFFSLPVKQEEPPAS